MPTAAPPQQVLYSCSNCDWTKTLDSFSVELATGTCPQCANALEWTFSHPGPPKSGRVVEITDKIGLSPRAQSEFSPPKPTQMPVREMVPETVLAGAASAHEDEPPTEAPDDGPHPQKRHTLRLVVLLLFLAGLVFTHMTLTSDPERAWDLFVELFPQATPTQIQDQELREIRERQKPTAEETAETPADAQEAVKPTP